MYIFAVVYLCCVHDTHQLPKEQVFGMEECSQSGHRPVDTNMFYVPLLSTSDSYLGYG